MVDMLMTEKKSSESSITQEPQTEEGSSSAPWCDLLENSPVPTTAVNLCEVNSTDDHEAIKSSSKEKLSVFGSFQKRTLSRLSFKGESGPLLSSMMELTPPAEAAAAQPSCPSHRIHLGDGMALSGLRRAISQVSMLVVKATNSGEVAWREECLKYRQTRFSSRRVRKRVVFKHGDCNVVQGNVAKRRRRYLQDIFTTLVDAQWRWTLLVFSMNFMLSWLGFAIVWWLIVYAHGDLDPRTIAESNGTFTPCVEDIHGFTSCFLFSVETQHTIGYGSKHTTEECPEAIFVMCIQSMTGVILQAFMVGIVFAKLSRPKKRTQTLLFSRNAVICQRDGQPCLMFRVGDMRKSHIIEAHIRAQMIKRKVTREGELLPFFQTELKVGGDGEEDKIIFIWPTTIVHKIDQNSPLYHLSASDMLRERFEIIVMLEGVIESTGMTTQARSSYLPSEILWGHRFEHIITFRKETGEYEVNYTLFNNTYEVDTPLCSAAQLDDLKAIHRAKGERLSSATFPTYRDNSSSSLTTSSGSSLASSTGGLHMHAATPPTPIPVTITAPDDSPRRDSISAQVDQRLATFYTQDEEAAEYQTMARSIDDYPAEQENYNRVLEGINASLRGQRRSSIQSKEEKRIPRENSKQSLASRRNDSRANVEGMTRSPTKISMDQPSISALKKSASRVTLDSRHTRFAESPDLEFLNDHRNKPEIRQVINLIVDEEDADINEHLKMNNLVKISSPPRSRPRPEVSDSKASNHYPLNAHPGEQV